MTARPVTATWAVPSVVVAVSGTEALLGSRAGSFLRANARVSHIHPGRLRGSRAG